MCTKEINLPSLCGSAFLFSFILFGTIWSPCDGFSDQINCSYPNLTSFLQEVASNYSNVSRLTSIGKTVEGRELWVLIISDQPQQRPLLRPQVKFVGNVVGYSGPSCYILLKLIAHLLTSFGNERSPERKLIQSNEIHILPNMNPDGFSKSIPGKCDGAVGKYNGGGQHLNRDFPHIFDPLFDDVPRQPETEAVMSWIHANNFLTSISYFSGAKVVTYPFDSVPPHEIGARRNQPHLTPDDDVFQHLTSSYVSHVENNDWHCPITEKIFHGGKINGAEWMPLPGTMMDYNYVEGTLEMFVGVTCCRNENDEAALEKIWINHKMAMLKIIQESEYAVKGQVLDSETKEPVPFAKLVKTYQNFRLNQKAEPIAWHSSFRGEFWRLILPGKYILQVSAEGYKTHDVNFEVQPLSIPKLLVELVPEKSRLLSKRFGPESQTTTAASPLTVEESPHEDEHGMMQSDQSHSHSPHTPAIADGVSSLADGTFAEQVPSVNVTSTVNMSQVESQYASACILTNLPSLALIVQVVMLVT